MSESKHVRQDAMAPKHKVCLIVIDGWGVPGSKPLEDSDAIAAAETPTMDRFSKSATRYVHLEASGNAVGLHEGMMGNSEVGHMNIGAGRICWQDIVRIDQSIDKGTLGNVEAIKDICHNAINGNGRLHFCGLVSPGGIHSHQNHLYALLKVAKDYGVPQVFIQFFSDGRDTAEDIAADCLQNLLDEIKKIGIGKVGTVVGRYYAMDRDKRWDRMEIALKGLVLGEGEATDDPVKLIREKYALPGDKRLTDEFLKPIIVNGDEARIKDGDSLFFFNFRADRVRQITQLLGDVDRDPLPDFKFPKVTVATMTSYKTDYPFKCAFERLSMDDVLAEWLAKKSIRQVHVAETEKYAHVTFFFNGGREKPFDLETRRESNLMPSNKSVKTYDLAPEMSALMVADRVCDHIANGYPFVMNNFAPPDMVGHTGMYEPAIRGCAVTDMGIKKIWDACKKHGYILFVTADHGNAEEMKFLDPEDNKPKPKTSHTTNPVPFIMAIPSAEVMESKGALMLGPDDPEPEGDIPVSQSKSPAFKDGKAMADEYRPIFRDGQKEDDSYQQGLPGWKLKGNGILGDVAPTILDAMGLPIPKSMTGKSLLVRE